MPAKTATTAKSNGKAAAPKGAAANRKAIEAAKDEVDEQPKPKSVTFKGSKLELPPQAPGTIMFDLISLEGEEADPLSMFRMLRSFLDWTDAEGTEHRGFLLVRNLVDPDLADVEPLFMDILEQYGMGLGEAEASPGS